MEIARLAELPIVVVIAPELLLPSLGSAVDDVTAALLLTVEPDGRPGWSVPTIVIVELPTGSDALVQVMVPTPPAAGVVHVHPAAV